MAEAREGGNRDRFGRVVPALVALWGVTLLAAFGAEHASTILTAGSAMDPTAADGPGILSATATAARAVVVAVAILGASAGYGTLLSSCGLGSLGFGRIADLCAELMLGAGFLSVVVFVLGHSSLLTPLPASIVVAGGLLSLVTARLRGPRPAAPEPPEAAAENRWDPVVVLAAAGIGVALLFALVTALAPPTARDALSYHLAAPKAYISSNAIVELPWSVHSYLPFAAEMLFTLGLLLGPDTAPNLIHLGFGAAVVAFVVVVARQATGSSRCGAVAGLLVASAPSVVWNAGIAHNEMWMTLAVTVAVVSIGRWWETGELRLLVWTGAAAGAALSAKHTALLLAPILAVAVLVRARGLDGKGQVRTVLGGALAAAVALVLPLPWYAQNAVRTGNPIFPYFWNVFETRSPVWDAERAEVLEAYMRLSYGQQDGVLAWMRLPWDLSVRAQNDVPSLFDGVIGPGFLFLAPFLAVMILKGAGATWLRVSSFVALAFAAGWATQSQQIRFLLPVLPVFAIAGVTSVASIGRSWPSIGAAGPALRIPLAGMIALCLMIAGSDLLASGSWRPVVGLESRPSYLNRRLAYIPIYERLNRELGRQHLVLLVDMRNDGYYLDVPFISDSVLEDYSIGRIVNSAPSPSAITHSLRSLGVSHVLVREDILLDPRFTPFDGPPAAARWAGFLSADTERLESRQGMALYALKN